MVKKKPAKKKTKRRPKRRFSNLIPGEYPSAWLNRCEPRLRELVLVSASPGDGKDWFDVLLTRVPGLGEEIAVEEKTFRVTRVTHEPVGYDGRARFGWHALIDVEFVPEPEPEPKPRKCSSRSAST